MSATVDRDFDLDRYLEVERAAVDAALERWVEDRATVVPPALVDPVGYAVRAGGKRLRPILCVAAYRAATARRGRRPSLPDARLSGREWTGERRTDQDRHPERAASRRRDDGVYTVAGALELIHTYSLVHDDLPCMDDDDLRRGRPSTHKAFGVERATLAGAVLIPLAFQAVRHGGQLLGLSADRRLALVRELSAAAGAGGMVGGQLLDLEAEGRDVTVEALESIHRRKTGALLAASLRLGGLAANAAPGTLEALGTFGRSTGLAFQIADDVLDVTATSTVLGKTAGKDAATEKATFPALLGLDAARRRARREAERGIDALRAAGIATPEIVALGRYAVERDR